jgi:hypothetical protein
MRGSMYDIHRTHASINNFMKKYVVIYNFDISHTGDSEKLNKGIEALRGVSIALVVLFHLGVNAFSNGYLGVDVFLIISGYLMMSLYGRASSADSWLSYYFKRVRRIYPEYVFVLFVVVVLSARIVLPFEYESVFGSSFPDVFLLGNIYSWGQSAYFARNLFRPTLHLWSLGVECQFYAIFPIMIILSRRSNTYLFADRIRLISDLYTCSYIVPENGVFPDPMPYFLPWFPGRKNDTSGPQGGIYCIHDSLVNCHRYVAKAINRADSNNVDRVYRDGNRLLVLARIRCKERCSNSDLPPR